MRLAVLGATGGTGVYVVALARDRGHAVTALARSSAKAREFLPVEADDLTVVEGDLTDSDAIAKAITGADAVVNVAGPVKGSPPDLQQRAMEAALDAMAAQGVDRLVTLTGAGVPGPGDKPKIADRVMRRMLGLFQAAMLADSIAYVDRVRASSVRWTIVRAPRLVSEDATGTFRVSPIVGPGSGIKIARADLANFLLDEVEQGRHIGGMPVVSW